MITLQSSHRDQIFDHARAAEPDECCGLVGGEEGGKARNVYRLRNIAPNPQVAYEAAPEELFAAQRQMRERGEQLLGIYHSHPLSIEPAPSEKDVRLAYYPAATYFIIGLGGTKPVMQAFSISERQQGWQHVEYGIADE